MCITAQEVRDTSVTGEFDAISDAVIDKQIAQTCPLYKTAIARNFNAWRIAVALHVAHKIHVRLKTEGADGEPGPVQSESFQQVGSRSYAVGGKDPSGKDWWASSPYGRDWKRIFDSFPPGLMALSDE